MSGAKRDFEQSELDRDWKDLNEWTLDEMGPDPDLPIPYILTEKAKREIERDHAIPGAF